MSVERAARAAGYVTRLFTVTVTPFPLYSDLRDDKVVLIPITLSQLLTSVLLHQDEPDRYARIRRA
jgi:hypothetical protein